MSALPILALIFGTIVVVGTLLVLVYDGLEHHLAHRVGRRAPSRAARPGRQRRPARPPEIVAVIGLVDPGRLR